DRTRGARTWRSKAEYQKSISKAGARSKKDGAEHITSQEKREISMAGVRPDEVSAILRQQLAGFEKEVDVYEVGTVLTVGDGVSRVYGLSKVMASELIEFPNGVFGMALNLEEDNVGAVLFGD